MFKVTIKVVQCPKGIRGSSPLPSQIPCHVESVAHSRVLFMSEAFSPHPVSGLHTNE